MKTELMFNGIRFGVTDGPIPEIDPESGHGTPPNHVGVYVDQAPLVAQEGNNITYTERRAMFYLKPSEARTLASALMTAAQSAR